MSPQGKAPPDKATGRVDTYPGEEVGGTLDGYTLWAYQRVSRYLKKKGGGVLVWMIDRLLQVDRENLRERFGISEEAFLDDVDGAEIVQLPPGDST